MARPRLPIRAVFSFVLSISAASSGCDASPRAHAGPPAPREAGTGGQRAGASGGSGAGGNAALDAPWVEPGFRVYLRGSAIVLEARKSSEKLGYRTCSNSFNLQKHSGGAWLAMQDDRHPYSQNPGYYLDGKYIDASMNLGCDVTNCLDFSEPIEVGRAEEYVKTGSMAPPQGARSQLALVDVVETRPFHGELRVDVQYSASPMCQETAQVTLALTIPEQGVCCPIGLDQCSSAGPGGGWASDLAACPPWYVTFDAYFRRGDDLRGCPQLIEDDSVCCGCPLEDAGT